MVFGVNDCIKREKESPGIRCADNSAGHQGGVIRQGLKYCERIEEKPKHRNEDNRDAQVSRNIELQVPRKIQDPCPRKRQWLKGPPLLLLVDNRKKSHSEECDIGEQTDFISHTRAQHDGSQTSPVPSEKPHIKGSELQLLDRRGDGHNRHENEGDPF